MVGKEGSNKMMQRCSMQKAGWTCGNNCNIKTRKSWLGKWKLIKEPEVKIRPKPSGKEKLREEKSTTEREIDLIRNP